LWEGGGATAAELDDGAGVVLSSRSDNGGDDGKFVCERDGVEDLEGVNVGSSAAAVPLLGCPTALPTFHETESQSLSPIPVSRA